MQKELTVKQLHPTEDHMKLMSLETRVDQLEAHVRCLFDLVKMVNTKTALPNRQQEQEAIERLKEQLENWEDPITP